MPSLLNVSLQLSFKTVPVLPSLHHSLIFPFHLLPSPVHPTGFFFCFFPGFLVIYTLLSSKNNSTRVTSTSRRSPSYFPFFFVFHLLLAPVNLTGISSHIFLAIFSCCYRKTAIIISIQLVKMYFNWGYTFFANDYVGSCSYPRISFHNCQKFHLLFSELNDTTNDTTIWWYQWYDHLMVSLTRPFKYLVNHCFII